MDRTEWALVIVAGMGLLLLLAVVVSRTVRRILVTCWGGEGHGQRRRGAARGPEGSGAGGRPAGLRGPGAHVHQAGAARGLQPGPLPGAVLPRVPQVPRPRAALRLRRRAAHPEVGAGEG